MGDERSPWERDDWMPAPGERRAVGPAEPAPVEHPVPAAHRSPLAAPVATGEPPKWQGRRRTVVATVAVIAVLAAFAAVRDDDLPRDAGVAPGGTTLFSEDPEPSSPEPSSPALSEPPTAPTTTASAAPTPASATSASRPADVTVAVPHLSEIDIGQVPAWTEWTIEVPPALAAATTASEIVVVSAEAVHRVELPGGRVRSIALTERWDPGADVAVLHDVVAISSYRTVVLVPDARPVTSVPFDRGVESIVARPARDDLLVSLRPSSRIDGHLQSSLSRDGRVVDLTELRQGDFPLWSPVVLPDGDLGASAPGGVYAVADDGTARRIGSGTLVAVGRNHHISEECDEMLRCGFVLVDARDGSRSVVADGSIDRASTTILSPDGSATVSARWASNPGSLVLTDLATGTSREIATILSFDGGDSWLADGSAFVAVDDGVVVFHGRTGWTASIGGFGLGARVAT